VSAGQWYAFGGIVMYCKPTVAPAAGAVPGTADGAGLVTKYGTLKKARPALLSSTHSWSRPEKTKSRTSMGPPVLA